MSEKAKAASAFQRAAIQSRHNDNPVLDQYLDPYLHVGLGDREVCSALRTQVVDRDVVITSDGAQFGYVVTPDPCRVLGTFGTNEPLDNQQHRYAARGNYKPGTDPIADSSILRLGSGVDAELSKYSLSYGAGASSSSASIFLRFLGAPTDAYGLCALNDNNGGFLPTDGYGFIKLDDAFVAGGGVISVRGQNNWDAPGTVPATNREQLAIYQYAAADPTLVGAGIGSQTVDSTVQTNFAFSATLVPGNGSYIRVRLNHDGTASGSIERNLVFNEFQLTWTGNDAWNYEFVPVTDAVALAALGQTQRTVACHGWTQYRSNVLDMSGNVASTQMPYKEFLAHGKPWTVEDIASRNSQFYEGQVQKGNYGIWGPTSQADVEFREWDNYGNDTYVLVVAMSGLKAGETFRLRATTCHEIATRKLVAGPQVRLANEVFLNQARTVLSNRVQWTGENPWHDRVIASLKKAGKWIYDNRDGIVKFAKTAGEVAVGIGKAVMPIAAMVV